MSISEPPPPSDIREAPVFAFLLGEGPLEGYWFGEHRPSGKRYPANFWWRKHLRAARASSPPAGDGKLREALSEDRGCQRGIEGAAIICGLIADSQDRDDWVGRLIASALEEAATRIRALSVRDAGEGK